MKQNKIKRYVLIAILSFFISYGMFSFSTMNINALEWSEYQRLVSIVIAMPIFVGILALLDEI